MHLFTPAVGLKKYSLRPAMDKLIKKIIQESVKTDNVIYAENGKYFAHTLNNTVVAPPRMLIAFLENNLQEDGSIKIPEVLRPYMGGKSVIK